MGFLEELLVKKKAKTGQIAAEISSSVIQIRWDEASVNYFLDSPHVQLC